MRYDEHIFVLGEFTQGGYLFLVSILHNGKGPNTTQTRTSKLMKIQTIKNLIHKEKNFQLPINIAMTTSFSSNLYTLIYNYIYCKMNHISQYNINCFLSRRIYLSKVS